MFTEKDLQVIKTRQIDLKTLEEQISFFKKGFPYLNIQKAATIGDGMQVYNEDEIFEFVSYYEESRDKYKIVKFVPASGAASRMFKSLYEFADLYNGNRDGYNNFMNGNALRSVMNVLTNIKKFAFYNDLEAVLQKDGKSTDELIAKLGYIEVLNALLNENGLNYGNLPKGLLKFHKYENEMRTPTEEHLVEGANYCKSSDKIGRLHFTVSSEHKSLFIKLIDEVKANYEKQFDIRYEISYSEQKPSTDTIAVDMENNPFRNSDGTLLFRPGGHGALIENLNDISADIIFVKNIDNVVPDRIKYKTFQYKKVIAGVLLKYKETVFSYINKLQQSNDISLINEVVSFFEKELCISFSNEFAGLNQKDKASYLLKKLNRPIRVCGMVKNEGEPGGGPFWAKNQDGTFSLQVVESSQIDMNNPQQKEIAQNATHFNPVDLVCYVKDYKGNKFDLLQFVDKNTGFISKKSKDGKDLKALELPGLWNGAMSDWNTIFVEVPIITFNPVKTIDDLLRKEHQ
ncbi:MAG TPA: DUF4301 domain-containing protein [Bacteroidales bacterium]|nr:MAG: NAD metabolism ATPase/kinase [Bacteroidetes bacterium GWF2_33_38]OFY70761.1 MAG: NAD metabolism ATPase/kinase [Bacteroidetes bacterium RIFOXYA12_FULL_33_9]OFY85978.1 MAG: NAD metabolism ATPase/kinase [Bacteroidetes bacterium RIFOXYA2_FULL_33_7]HBF88761.1 DUF4301 domain-containing protein [Bacteroidales bacterium]